MTLYLSYFHFCVFKFVIKKDCRGIMRIILLLFRCMLEQPYIKFMQTLASSKQGEMYKKILCPLITKNDRGRVNQQVTTLNPSKLNTYIKEESKIINVGTSETACEITFQFLEYSKNKSEHKSKINQQFLEWFIGFTEGDGSFVISKNKVYFDITQNLQDIQVLYYIKKELGFGKVLIRNEPHINVGVFYVTSELNFYKLITIFNGNLCSNYKKEQFKKWLSVFNTQYNRNVEFNPRLVKPSLNTAWLSGFIDAEGSFTGRVKYCRTSQFKKAPHLTFSLSQKEFSILFNIRELFLPYNSFEITIPQIPTSQKNIRYDKSWDGWQLHISSFVKLKEVRNYINLYNLKTKKQISYLRWSKIHNMVLNKEHLTLIGLDKITQLCSKINNHFLNP